MKQDTKKIIELFQQSSLKTQKFLQSGGLQKIIVSFEKTYKLTEKESRVLQEQSIAFLFELVSLNDFETELSLVLRNRNSAEIERILTSIKQEILSQRG